MSAAPETVDAGWLRRHPLPLPEADDDKSARGTVLVAGGCAEAPGAVLLSGVAALRAGAGRLQLATARSIAPHLALAVPEALVIGLDETEGGCVSPAAAGSLAPRLARASAALLGPGLAEEGAGELTEALLRAVETGPALVLDAAALTGLGACAPALRPHAARCVVTPHAGEMARLLGVERDKVRADPLAAARRAADLLGCTVALKGARTLILGPEGEVLSCEHGHVGLATSGSGDTLAGIVAGLLARGVEPLPAAVWAVWLHAEAGQRLARGRGPLGFLARELLDEVPAIMAEF